MGRAIHNMFLEGLDSYIHQNRREETINQLNYFMDHIATTQEGDSRTGEVYFHAKESFKYHILPFKYGRIGEGQAYEYFVDFDQKDIDRAILDLVEINGYNSMDDVPLESQLIFHEQLEYLLGRFLIKCWKVIKEGRKSDLKGIVVDELGEVLDSND